MAQIFKSFICENNKKMTKYGECTFLNKLFVDKRFDYPIVFVVK